MEEVTYEKGRNYIQDGDIVFVKNKKTVIARAVQFFTRSAYSHVGIAFWAQIGKERRLMIVEDQGNTRRRIVNASFYYGCDLDVIEAPKSWSDVQCKALAKVGIAHYGYGEALYVGFRETLLQYFGIRLPTRDMPGMICSEFVADIYGLKETHVSPHLLIKNLLAEKHKFRVKISRSLTIQ